MKSNGYICIEMYILDNNIIDLRFCQEFIKNENKS